MTNLLLDTDIILDFFYDRKPHSEHSAKVLSLCESNEVKGFITPVILSNLYYLLRQSSTHERVIEKLSQLISITEVLLIDRVSIIQALNSNFKDFEDALQHFSAECNGNIDLILTRNLKDFKNSSLGVMTPENYLKMRVVNR
ncbi:MAG: PIN domain-containing protein [Bacteroidales bacterium]|nr:PIN domain-containing protein [Bacteroidales bacterium]